jgi:hypothetical protein
MARVGRAVLIAAIASVALPAEKPQGSSVASVIALVRKSIQRHESDNKLAHELQKTYLAQALDDHTIEELESEGAGPKTVEGLLDLRDASAGLPGPEALPDFPAPPLPLRQEQDEILKSASAHALSYSAGLPDFICTEMVRRYEDVGGSGKWKPRDMLKVKLTYFGHREDYQLVSINDRPTHRSYESVGGAVSEGEFGTDLLTLFLPQSHTEIRWDHWTHLRKHVAHVFFYRIDRSHSRYQIEFGMGGRHSAATVGEHGYFYVDRESAQVLRITRTADIAPDFPVRRAVTLLDYDFTDVAGRRFLLPLRADIRMATDYILTRNHLEFTAYRKFEGESKITFDQAK